MTRIEREETVMNDPDVSCLIFAVLSAGMAGALGFAATGETTQTWRVILGAACAMNVVMAIVQTAKYILAI